MEPSPVILKNLLEFVPQAQRQDLVDRLLTADTSLAGQVPDIARKAFEHHHKLKYEKRREGPQALNHYAWTMVVLGNYCRSIGTLINPYHLEAWRAFTDPNNEGNEDKGLQLTKEHPELLAHPEIDWYYSSSALVGHR